jgi:RNA polymerase sigma factor (sigma-70 family)
MNRLSMRVEPRESVDDTGDPGSDVFPRPGPDHRARRAETGSGLTEKDGPNSPDEQSWAEAFARYQSLVWACIRKYDLCGSDAEDVFQNTWTVAVRRKLRPPSGPACVRFLAAIVHWEIRSLFKFKRRKLERLPESLIDAEADLTEQFVIEAEERQIVWLCVQALRPVYRQVLQHLFVDGLGYRETADKVGIAAVGVGPLGLRAVKWV